MASTRRKTGIRLGLIFGILGVLGIGGMWYSALVFWPTGYSEFETVQKESSARVEELIVKPVPRAPSARPTRKPEAPPPSFSQALRNSSFTLMSFGVREGDNVRVALAPDFLVVQSMLQGGWIAARGSASDGGLAEPRQALSGKRSDILQYAWGECARDPGHVMRIKASGDCGQATLDGFRDNLDALLPKIESFLLERIWLQPKHGSLYSQSPVDDFNKCSSLAILRAAATGESKKSARLFAGYLEVLRSIHLASFPHRREWTWQGAQDLILTLGEMEEFPAEALRDGLPILEGALLGPEQFRDLRIAYAGILRNDLLDRLGDGRSLVREESSYHFFADGAVEGFGLRAILPVLKKQIDRYMAAFAGDPKEAEDVRNDLLFWFNAANLDPKRSGPWNAIARRDWTADPSRDCEELRSQYNKEVQFTLLALGAAIFRKESGRYPDSIAELDSAARSSALDDSEKSAWEILRLLPGRPSDQKSYVGPVIEIDREYPVLCRASFDSPNWDQFDGLAPETSPLMIEVRTVHMELICQMRLEWLKRVYGLEPAQTPGGAIE
jgi:hypothetical protein